MTRILLTMCVALGASAARAQDLPTGALARIGSGIVHPHHLRDFSFSPDGKSVATIGDATPRVWDVATGRVVRELSGHNGVGVAVAFSPDGRRLATAAGEPGVLIWDTATWKQLGRVPSDAASSVTFSPDSRTLAVVSMGGKSRGVELFDVEARTALRPIARADRTDQLAFSPDGRTIATTGFDRTVSLYEVATGQLRAKVEKLTLQSAGVAFAPGGAALYVAGGDTPLKAIDPLTGKEIKTFTVPASRVAVSPDGRTVAAYSSKGEVRLLDSTSGNELRKWTAQVGPMQRIAFSPDGKRVATTGWKHARVHLYDAATGTAAGAGLGHDAAVLALALSPDGKTLATSGDDNTVRIWSVTPGVPPSQLRRIDVPRTLTYRALAFSPDGRRLAGGADTGDTSAKTVRVWDVDTAQEVLALQSADNPRGATLPMGCDAVAFSPDGAKLASGGLEAGFHLWDAVSGKELARHGGGRRAGATGLAFGSDGKTVYVTTWNGGVSAWSLDPAPDKLVRPFDGPHARCVAAARNANVVAGGGADGTVRAWDSRGKLLFQGTGHGGPLSAVAVSADGRLVAAAGSNSVVKVWDLETAQVRAEYKGHLGRVNGLAFAPDGQLVSAGGDGVVYVWGTPTPSELDRMWGELGGADAARAFKAIGELVAQPDKSVPHLARRIPKPDAPRVRTLLDQLSGTEGSAAVEELARLGSLVEPDVRRAKDAAKTDDVKVLLAKLLDPKGPAAWPNEGLRLTRAVEALERIGTPAARALLQQVVTDWKETAPGRDAAESLERLNSRKP